MWRGRGVWFGWQLMIQRENPILGPGQDGWAVCRVRAREGGREKKLTRQTSSTQSYLRSSAEQEHWTQATRVLWDFVVNLRTTSSRISFSPEILGSLS
jgi:hypothetical protein